MSPLRSALMRFAFVALGVVLVTDVWASCPKGAVTLVVPYAAGGPTDALARSLSEMLARSWGVPVVVANRGGANGIIATVSVTRAPADGHTILMHLSGLIQNASLYKKLPYDPFTDLVAVSRIGTQAMALATSSQSQSDNLHAFISALSNRRTYSTYGSFGAGSTGHIYGEVLRKSTAAEMTHVPYRGEAHMLPELQAGRLDVGFVSAAQAIASRKDGTLRILGVTGAHRLAALPDVPTLAEAGLKGFELIGWYGLFVPRGTPASTVDCIARDTQAALARPEMSQRLKQLAVEPMNEGPLQFSNTLRDDFKRWNDLIKTAAITLE